jgi:hypothetical protein
MLGGLDKQKVGVDTEAATDIQPVYTVSIKTENRPKFDSFRSRFLVPTRRYKKPRLCRIF